AAAAGLRAASAGDIRKVDSPPEIFHVPLGWNFNAQNPATAGDIFRDGRTMLSLKAGTEKDLLGNVLPQNAFTMSGSQYTETVDAGVVIDNTAWTRSQTSSVGIEFSFLGLFSAGVEYSNMAKSSFAQSTTQHYAQIAGNLALQRVTLPLYGLQLADDVTEALSALPPLSDSTTLAAYANFFNQWDAHIVTEYTIGGSAHMYSSFDSTVTERANIDAGTIGAFIQAAFANWGAGLAGNHSWTKAQGEVLMQANSRTQIACRGGNAAICAQFNIKNTTSTYDQWVNSVKQDNQAAMIVTSVSPLWDEHFGPNFLPRPGMASDLKKAYSMYLAACPGVSADNNFICSGRGQCDLTGTATGGNGTCDCFAGYGGPTCACPSQSSQSDCSGHGTCSSVASPGTCTCAEGWAGDDCSKPAQTCPMDYYFGTGTCGSEAGHGACNQVTGKCKCAENWSGPRCNIPCGGLDLDTPVGPGGDSWWIAANYPHNSPGYATKGSHDTIWLHTPDGYEYAMASTFSRCQSGSQEQAADNVCQFVFNYLAGQRNEDIATVPVQQDPTFGPGWSIDLFNTQVCPTGGYDVYPNMTAPGTPPDNVGYEFGANQGQGYKCNALCVPNE
ncbi:tenm4, partial [Symbiodinium sp. KB8]